MGGKMADFAGWMLPLWYPTGQVAEHHAVRKTCGLFDICHMGEFEITGDGAAAFLSRMLTNDLSRMTDRQAMYYFLLNESAGTIDDCILYRFDVSHWMLVVNAGNTRTDLDWLRAHLPSGTSVADISGRTAKLDIQGPAAPRLMSRWIAPPDLSNLKFFRFIPGVTIDGMEVLVSRTGYTGEIGFELYTNSSNAADLWNLLLSEGKTAGILPCGLGARDTLRIEAGLPLHGHELRPDWPCLGHPWEFALFWEHEFMGKEALLEYRNRGPCRFIQAFAMNGRRKAMAGWQVFSGKERIGTVLSSVISPTLGNVPIGFFEADRMLPEGTPLTFAQADGSIPLDGKAARIPFVPPTSRRSLDSFMN